MAGERLNNGLANPSKKWEENPRIRCGGTVERLTPLWDTANWCTDIPRNVSSVPMPQNLSGKRYYSNLQPNAEPFRPFPSTGSSHCGGPGDDDGVVRDEGNG